MVGEFIILMGVVTFFYSLYECIKFFRTGTKLGNAVAVVLASLCFCVFCTLIFAVLSHTAVLITLAGNVQSLLRFVMFASGLFAVRYLDLVVTKIVNSETS